MRYALSIIKLQDFNLRVNLTGDFIDTGRIIKMIDEEMAIGFHNDYDATCIKGLRIIE